VNRGRGKNAPFPGEKDGKIFPSAAIDKNFNLCYFYVPLNLHCFVICTSGQSLRQSVQGFPEEAADETTP